MSHQSSIAIDTRWLAGLHSGVAKYLVGLIGALPEADPALAYHLFGTELPRRVKGVVHHPFSGYFQWGMENYWHFLRWPSPRTLGPDPDLWHFPNYSTMPTRRPYVTTVYDLAFERYPEYTEAETLKRLRKYLPATIAGAERVLAISEATKQAVIKQYGTPEDKIVVTHLAADKRFSRRLSAADRGKVLRRYKLQDPYFLAVGNLEPRKNLAALFKAYAAQKGRLDLRLAIVGGQGWYFDETKRLIGELGITDRVTFLGYVPDPDLPALYQGAEAFVFPSHYEGFGIPILEAMASGTPVVTSNTSSMPEVYGDAALAVDPENTAALSKALVRITDEPTLRKELVAAGRKRVKRFSWQRTAKETAAVYRDVLGDSR
ncbi:MAG: glycosyltransferase family 4 protein [bacterium]|nr:glycosyltransferase family 4 protein [bacterium]